MAGPESSTAKHARTQTNTSQDSEHLSDTLSGIALLSRSRGCRRKLTSYSRYGYHVPAVRKRDLFYSKLEDKRAANMSA